MHQKFASSRFCPTARPLTFCEKMETRVIILSDAWDTSQRLGTLLLVYPPSAYPTTLSTSLRCFTAADGGSSPFCANCVNAQSCLYVNLPSWKDPDYNWMIYLRLSYSCSSYPGDLWWSSHRSILCHWVGPSTRTHVWRHREVATFATFEASPSRPQSRWL